MSREAFLAYIKASDARSDPNFDLYRVETAALKRLKDVKDLAYLAVGLKGIGKSACFRTLSAGDGAEVIQPISAETQEPQDISASRPTLQYVQELRTELVLQALITLVQALRVDTKLRKKVAQDAQQNAQVLVTDIWGKLKNTFGGLGGVTVLGFGISFKAKGKKDSPTKLVAREDYTKALDILKRAAKDASFRLVVDDPEAIFAADQEINRNLIAALAIAANELQIQVPNFKCVILIKPNVLRALSYVDEFANLPSDSRVKLSWTDDELKEVVRARANAAKVELKDVFAAPPEPALDVIVADSRSGPRDALRRLELHFDAYPGDPVTPDALEKTIGAYSDACFQQMFAAYEAQYPGLVRASLVLFEGRDLEIAKSALRNRLDQMIATSKEVLAFKDQEWARDAAQFSDLLVQFGLVAVKSGQSPLLPFHANYVDEATKPEAVFTYLPALRGRIQFAPPAAAAPAKPNRGRNK